MAAAHPELPAVARRRVRLALRSAREETGKSQNDVAAALGWSLSKLQRIELGEVTISPTDLRAVLQSYGVTDEERIGRLAEETRIARRERYATAQEHRDHLSPGLLQLMQFELAATAIREYQSTLVPGHFQTRALVDATLGWFDKSLTAEERRVRRDVRLRRRRDLIERDGASDLFLMLDESVLLRSAAGQEDAAEQFEDLAETALRPHVHVRILPLDTGTLLGTFGAFTVLDLSAEAGDAVLYRESYTRDDLVQDPVEVGYHREVFERFWRRSLDEEASRALIVARAAVLRARIARAACDVKDDDFSPIGETET